MTTRPETKENVSRRLTSSQYLFKALGEAARKIAARSAWAARQSVRKSEHKQINPNNNPSENPNLNLLKKIEILEKELESVKSMRDGLFTKLNHLQVNYDKLKQEEKQYKDFIDQLNKTLNNERRERRKIQTELEKLLKLPNKEKSEQRGELNSTKENEEKEKKEEKKKGNTKQNQHNQRQQDKQQINKNEKGKKNEKKKEDKKDETKKDSREGMEVDDIGDPVNYFGPRIVELSKSYLELLKMKEEEIERWKMVANVGVQEVEKLKRQIHQQATQTESMNQTPINETTTTTTPMETISTTTSLTGNKPNTPNTSIESTLKVKKRKTSSDTTPMIGVKETISNAVDTKTKTPDAKATMPMTDVTTISTPKSPSMHMMSSGISPQVFKAKRTNVPVSIKTIPIIDEPSLLRTEIVILEQIILFANVMGDDWQCDPGVEESLYY